MFVLIPIYTDNFLHPNHDNNKLSLLYLRHYGDRKGTIINVSHPDTHYNNGNLQDISNDESYFYITTNKKQLMNIFPKMRLIDANCMNWWDDNKPLNLEEIKLNAYDFFYNKFYNIKNINQIIPLVKHMEYCDIVFNKITDNIKQAYDHKYNCDAINAYNSIEINGIKVSNDICDIFDDRVLKHISNGKLYSDYNLWTSTGRPSNSFGSVNFAALTNKQRKAILPCNDYLIEFDYDAYHLRLIGDLVQYTFPNGSVHKHLSELYGLNYEESKQMSFKLLYGGITNEVANSIEFFKKTKHYINTLWYNFNHRNYVKTNIYNRRLYKYNLHDMNKNKLFNYLIQAHETETNIQTILELQKYLLNKKTNLILYGYDSFLFDVSNHDGINVVRKIKEILERNGHLTKSKMGINYSDMKDITKKLQEKYGHN